MSAQNSHVTIEDLDRASLIPEPPPPRKKLLHADELDSLPPLTWLIDGEIPRNGLSALVGPSEGGKSFVALDEYALPLAQQHNVVYIAGEGSSGYAARKNAYCEHHQTGTGGLHFWLEAVNFLDDRAVAEFIAAVQPLEPTLIVIDTLARCMVGGDENSARDMGLFIAACDRVRNETGSALLIVHHTGKGGDYRGSSAFKGAVDTMIELSNDDGLITLSCAKVKDGPRFPTRCLRMLPVGPSCVLVPAALVVQSQSIRLTNGQRKMLEFLALDVFEAVGARSGDIEKGNVMPRASIFHVLSSLKRLGYISQGAKGDPYSITDAGREALRRETEASTSNSLKLRIGLSDAQVQQSNGDPHSIIDVGCEALHHETEASRANSPTFQIELPNTQVQQSNASLKPVQQTSSLIVQSVSHSLRSETETRLQTPLDDDLPSKNGRAKS